MACKASVEEGVYNPTPRSNGSGVEQRKMLNLHDFTRFKSKYQRIGCRDEITMQLKRMALRQEDFNENIVNEINEIRQEIRGIHSQLQQQQYIQQIVMSEIQGMKGMLQQQTNLQPLEIIWNELQTVKAMVQQQQSNVQPLELIRSEIQGMKDMIQQLGHGSSSQQVRAEPSPKPQQPVVQMPSVSVRSWQPKSPKMDSPPTCPSPVETMEQDIVPTTTKSPSGQISQESNKQVPALPSVTDISAGMAKLQPFTGPKPSNSGQQSTNTPQVTGPTAKKGETFLFVNKNVVLYHFDAATKRWNETVKGNMMVMHHYMTGRSRLLMRDTECKSCFDHDLTPQTCLRPWQKYGDRSLSLAIESEESQPKKQFFGVKFQSKEEAQKFKSAFFEAKRKLNGPVDPIPGQTPTEEEGENVLYAEQATLYHFLSEAKQWREKGKGCIKVLQHKTSGRYRLLMRRELDNKECCNHEITAHLPMKRRQGSNVAWTWSALDRSEGTSKSETFVVKLPSKERAQQFGSVFEEVQKKLPVLEWPAYCLQIPEPFRRFLR